jgi:predicted patatin/cPLA2 family phospholipase
VGSLQYLQDKGILPNIRKFIGTSIGAIIAYLVCIGYNPIEIMIISCQRKIFENLANIDILNVMNGNGAISFHIFQEILEKLTIEKIKKFITLSDLHTRFGKELVCCTYNLTLGNPEYISYKTHPDLNCLTALRMSANLPFFFETFVYDDYKYVDGGIADNFPISQVDEGDIALGIRTKKILSADSNKNKDENILTQFVAILTVPIGRVEEIQISYEKNTDVISVPIPSYISTSLNLSNTEKFDLFSNGYDTIKKFFANME